MTAIFLRPGHALVSRLAGWRPLISPLTDLPLLLDQVDTWGGNPRQDVTVIVRGAPRIVGAWSAHVQEGKVGPWRVTGGRIGAWSSFVLERNGQGRRPRALHIGIAELIDPRKTPLFHPTADDEETIVRRLQGFHHATGAAWCMTGGVSGCASIKQSFQRGHIRRDDIPHWGIGARREIADERQAAGDYAWERELTRQEAACRWVHAYDLNAARLAAARVQELPFGRLERAQEAVTWSPKQAGYYLVREADLPQDSPWRPPLAPRGRALHGLTWLTSPILCRMGKQGHHIEIVEAYLSDARKWLARWAATVDAARVGALHRYGRKSPEYLAIRSVWTETFGMIERDGGSISLPVVAHSVIDRQRVTVSTHIDRVYDDRGVYPFKVVTDALYYVSNDPDPQGAIPLKIGTGLGEFKVIPGYPMPMSVWQAGTDARKLFIEGKTQGE